MSWLNRVDPEDTLNFLYKNLPPRSTKRLENYNGKRHISVYRGKDFMNKTTHKLDPDYPLMFIRRMLNFGTKKDPKLKTAEVQLRNGDTDVFVYIDRYKFNVPQDGIHLEIINRGTDSDPYQKPFKSFMEMRKDNYFMKTLERMTGKILTK